MPIVVDEPERSERTWTRRWEADRWRGSSGDLLDAASKARQEIVALGLGVGLIETVEIGYKDDSNQSFGSLQAWRTDASQENPDEVRSLTITLDGVSAKTIMTGAPADGLTVIAEGSETFANGVQATMRARLSGGRDAGQKAASAVPMPRWIWLGVLAALIPAGGGAWLEHSVETFEPSVEGPLIMGGLGYVIGLVALSFPVLSEREKRLPPRFQLVQEGDQFPNEIDETNGPAWRTRRWLERHFVIGLLLNWFGAGLVGAAIALFATKAI